MYSVNDDIFFYKRRAFHSILYSIDDGVFQIEIVTIHIEIVCQRLFVSLSRMFEKKFRKIFSQCDSNFSLFYPSILRIFYVYTRVEIAIFDSFFFSIIAYLPIMCTRFAIR